jgi:hypothetical protein
LSNSKEIQYFGNQNPHHFGGSNIGEFIGPAGRGINLGGETVPLQEIGNEGLLGH